MTATDELRCLLDERGVWHQDIVDATLWTGSNGNAYTAAEVYTRGNTKPSTKRLVIRHMATPEQAIAATLGAGTCHITDNGPWGYPYVCSACGASFDPDVNNGEFNYCPNCGRKVVDE